MNDDHLSLKVLCIHVHGASRLGARTAAKDDIHLLSKLGVLDVSLSSASVNAGASSSSSSSSSASASSSSTVIFYL